MSYGQKIAELRKNKGMTQAALGEKLNVTYQAVSKWERDESDPDFATMARIAKLFEVPLTYFEDEESATAEAAPAAAVAEPSPLNTEELKAEIKEELKADAEKARQEEERVERENRIREQQSAEAYEKSTVLRKRNRGLIVGGILTAVALVIAILMVVYSDPPVSAGIGVGFCAVAVVFGYTFFSQLFWCGFILDVVMCGGKIIGTPGIIFSFDLDGFIFLIVMKILFALLKMLFFILTLIFFVVVAILLSPFSFVPQLIKISRGEDLD